VPACRTLDCLSVFALCCSDAQRVFHITAKYDEEDPFSRRMPSKGSRKSLSDGFRFGTPLDDQLEFFGNESARGCFQRAVESLSASGGTGVEMDIRHFLDTAKLLYEGPWLAERYTVAQDLLRSSPGEILPTTRLIIEQGASPSAVSAFEAAYELAALKRASERIWNEVDYIATPTAGTIYRIEEVMKDPLTLNANLGYYTNFVNLLDLTAVAVPAGFLDSGLPFGITLFAPAGSDEALLHHADRFHRSLNLPLGRAEAAASSIPEMLRPIEEGEDAILLAVCGAHMRDMPLNGQLLDLKAQFVRSTRTSPDYRFFALAATTPAKPGLVRGSPGASIEIEVWSLSPKAFGEFVATVPSPLCIGKVETLEGDFVSGFLCEQDGLDGAEEITRQGSWRTYCRSRCTQD